MSQIDTRGFANSYLGGAGLGTQQFFGLADMMRSIAQMNLREREFAADQTQREVSNSLNERQFGRQLENDVVAQDQWAQGHDLDLNQFAQRQREFGLQESQFDLRNRQDQRQEQQRATTSKAYATMARVILDKSAANRAMAQGTAGPGMNPTQGPPTSPGGQVGQVGQGGAQMGPMMPPAPDPADEQWRGMIDSLEWSGDAEALGQIMPFLMDERKRSEQILLMKALTDDGVIPDLIPNDTPQNRATRSLLRAFQEQGKPDLYVEQFARWMQTQDQPRITPELASAMGLPPSMIGTPWTPAANQMATQNRAFQKMQPQGKPGNIRYNPGGNMNKTLMAPVSIGGGQPLVWDPSNPDVQQFIDVARMGMPGRDAGQYDKHSRIVDAISLGFAGEEGDDEYNARVDKYARQLAAVAQWVVHEPGQEQGVQPAGAVAAGGMTPLAPVERIQQTIGTLKAQGLNTQQIKQRLTEMGLVR